MATITVPAVRRSADRLLLAGALAGPVFFASAIAQMLTREGFAAATAFWIDLTNVISTSSADPPIMDARRLRRPHGRP